MSETRTCNRCKGEEFQLLAQSGQAIIWRHASGHEDTWFCPNCDWGAMAREQSRSRS